MAKKKGSRKVESVKSNKEKTVKSREPKVTYRKDQIADPLYLDKLNQMHEVDTRFAIVMAINNFGSCNIKKLARILGKNEATIHHHIKWLSTEPSLLDIDQKKTLSTKGIFYTLAEQTRLYYYDPGKNEEAGLEELESKLERIDHLLTFPDEKIYQWHLDLIRKHPEGERNIIKERRLMSYNHILENIILENFEEALFAFAHNKEPVNPRYPFGALSNFALDMQVSSSKHLFQIVRLFTKLDYDFSLLKHKILEDMNEQEIPQKERIDMHFHVVGGEIAEFDFE